MVVDASAIVAALIEKPRVERLVDLLVSERVLHAPHVVDLEVASALRGIARGGKLEPWDVADAFDRYSRLAIERYPHAPLLPRIWRLGANLSVYDASYVALAELLELPLVTADARLAKATGHAAQIELV